MKKYTGFIISDIHFGKMNNERLIKELNEVFLYYIKKSNDIDFVIIDGDYYDCKLYLNSESVNYAFSFMSELCELALRKNFKIRIVYGTASHEANQYNVFKIFENNDNIDFKVIYTVTEEYLFKDLKVLYLPEEFMIDKKEYYKDYFNKKKEYDYIFGHGIIQEIMTDATKSMNKETTNKRLKVPIFTSGELESMCKGLCFFGHYHVSSNINNIFYVGSFTRWVFDEEKEKGFFITTKEKNIYEYKFIENHLAPSYITINHDESSNIFNDEEEFLKEINRVDSLLENKIYDNIRLKINIPLDYSNSKFIMDFLKEKYSFNKSIKIIIEDKSVVIKDEKEKEQLMKVIDKYKFIFDKSLPLENKLSYFIKEKHDKDIPIESIKTYLYDDYVNIINFKTEE